MTIAQRVGQAFGGLFLAIVALVLGIIGLHIVAWVVGSIGGRLASFGGSDGVTVYPVVTCQKLCTTKSRTGKDVKRFRLTWQPETYRGIPEAQEVIVVDSLGVSSLTRDRRFKCRVFNERTWTCDRDLSDDGTSFETYTMRDGDLHYGKLPMDADKIVQYLTACQWHQIELHNGWSDDDDRGYEPSSGLRLVFAPIVYLATGCML